MISSIGKGRVEIPNRAALFQDFSVLFRRWNKTELVRMDYRQDPSSRGDAMSECFSMVWMVG
jgi:hypothetical protein